MKRDINIRPGLTQLRAIVLGVAVLLLGQNVSQANSIPPLDPTILENFKQSQRAYSEVWRASDTLWRPGESLAQGYRVVETYPAPNGSGNCKIVYVSVEQKSFSGIAGKYHVLCD